MSSSGILIETVVEPYPMRNRQPFAKAHPDLAAFWLYERNCGFAPHDFSRGSGVKVWWFCPNGTDHKYRQSISTHVRSSQSRCGSCPYCAARFASKTNRLSTQFPKLAKEWSEKNEESAHSVVSGSHRQAWWQCKFGHEWQASVKSRTQRSSGCPKCKGYQTDLRNYPDALRQFDKKKNNWLDPFSLSPRKKVWWRCTQDREHTWFAAFDTLKGARCPLCTGKDPQAADRLSDDARLKREFHPTKNGSLKAKDLTLWSHKRVWWKCAKGPDHEWQTSVKDRASYKTGCPFCGNRRLSVTNSLANVAPHVAREWHPKRNKPQSPDNVVATTMTKYWFVCKSGHEYQQNPFQRVNFNRGCSACYFGRGSSSSKG
jgi:hypothetical protein